MINLLKIPLKFLKSTDPLGDSGYVISAGNKKVLLRRDSAVNWIVANPILSAGEPGVNLDNNRVKIGDGVTSWIDLMYFNSDEK